jgi:electron transport complex protein RnfA
MNVGEILLMMFTAVLVENFIFSRFYGCCPFLGVSGQPDTALGMGMAVTFVMTLSSAVTWLVYDLLLAPFHLEYLRTVAFILVIAALVQLVEIILKKYIPALHASLGIYLPLITTNCAVLGVTINNINDGYNFLQSTVSALGCGLGFLLAMVLFAGVRSRLEEANPPEAFKGLPITLVAASIVALSFMGFQGLVDGIFGV